MKWPPRRRYGLLGDDLLGEVPGQQQTVVGPVLEESLRAEDRQVLAGHEPPLLVDVAVHHVVEQLGADADIVDQGAPLAAAP